MNGASRTTEEALVRRMVDIFKLETAADWADFSQRHVPVIRRAILSGEPFLIRKCGEEYRVHHIHKGGKP